MTKYTLLLKLNEDMPENVKSYYLTYKSNFNDDSGFDLMTSKPVTFIRGEKPTKTVEFNINCAMIDNENTKPVGFYLYPRSSTYKYNLILWNHVGIIDAGYRGEIKAKVRWFDDDSDKLEITNEKLFQICSPDLSPFEIKIVNKLPISSRDCNGFGSTGI